jgi:hypothetical protein
VVRRSTLQDAADSARTRAGKQHGDTATPSPSRHRNLPGTPSCTHVPIARPATSERNAAPTATPSAPASVPERHAHTATSPSLSATCSPTPPSTRDNVPTREALNPPTATFADHRTRISLIANRGSHRGLTRLAYERCRHYATGQERRANVDRHLRPVDDRGWQERQGDAVPQHG